jgi:hypothetical protein
LENAKLNLALATDRLTHAKVSLHSWITEFCIRWTLISRIWRKLHLK